MGTTSRNEVVPWVTEATGACPIEKRARPSCSLGSQVIRRAVLARERVDGSQYGRRSLPSIARRGPRDQSRKHGVSDPGARAANGPAPVRRGRSRHAVSVSDVDRPLVRVWRPMNQPNYPAIAHASQSVWPADLGPFVREDLNTNRDSFRTRFEANCHRPSRSGPPACSRDPTSVLATVAHRAECGARRLPLAPRERRKSR